MGFRLKQVRPGCPWGDSTMPERGEDSPYVQLLCWGALRSPVGPCPGTRPLPTPMVPGTWSCVPPKEQRQRQASETPSGCGRRATHRAQHLVLADTLPSVSPPDSWPRKHLPQMGGRALETCQVFITDGKCHSWRLWSRLKPSVSSLHRGTRAVPFPKAASTPQPV